MNILIDAELEEGVRRAATANHVSEAFVVQEAVRKSSRIVKTISPVSGLYRKRNTRSPWMRWSAVPNWQIELSNKAEETLLRLDKPIRMRILRYLRKRLADHPDTVALAEPLNGEFKGLFRFRVGDYRLISDIQQDILLILVLQVRHRGEAYRKGLKK